MLGPQDRINITMLPFAVHSPPAEDVLNNWPGRVLGFSGLGFKAKARWFQVVSDYLIIIPSQSGLCGLSALRMGVVVYVASAAAKLNRAKGQAYGAAFLQEIQRRNMSTYSFL